MSPLGPGPTTAGPLVDAAGVTFRLADHAGRLTAARLLADVGLPGPADFARAGAAWRLRIPRPPVDRLEYLFQVADRGGGRFAIADPDNPRRVGGAFGPRSVVRFPGYRQPAWLGLPGIPARVSGFRVPCRVLRDTVAGTLWAPADLPATARAPLLLVNDGPEYDRLGDLTRYLAALIGSGALPPLRAALLDPGPRGIRYAANPAYSWALATEVIPALERRAPSTVRVGVGVSLGALAMLHAHRRYPRSFAGLLLQSGSFFTPDLDLQERDFPRFPAIAAFVAGVAREKPAREPVPVVLTCGLAEKVLADNRAMAATLARQGYPVALAEVRDAHNYTAWRDALHPHLTDLVGTVTGWPGVTPRRR